MKSHSNSTPVQLKATKTRDKLQELFGVHHSSGERETDGHTKPLISAFLTAAKSPMRNLLGRCNRKACLRTGASNGETEHKVQIGESLKSKGKKRESEPNSEVDSDLDE